ncbi:hypothetical protein [Methylocapsa acidiphila]|uniref:hypothetical protein n=1 Tax=Methylocapsa acidiphila TaxID=133552 RepID=UPI00041A129D|nr:hypothetical protein [Methylocapsa acidiphila]
MFVRAASLSLLAMTLLGTVARADAVLSSDNDSKCVVRVGPDLIHVTAYQAHDPRAEFCKDIPYTGPVTIVLDYVDAELRGMMTDIRVIKDVGGGSDASGAPQILDEAQVAPEALDPVTEAHLPGRLYPTGTISFQHVFTTAGKYQGIVTVKNDHGQVYVSQFPFSVGHGRRGAIMFYGMIATSIVGGAVVYWLYARWASRNAAAAKRART